MRKGAATWWLQRPCVCWVCGILESVAQRELGVGVGLDNAVVFFVFVTQVLVCAKCVGKHVVAEVPDGGDAGCEAEVDAAGAVYGVLHVVGATGAMGVVCAVVYRAGVVVDFVVEDGYPVSIGNAGAIFVFSISGVFKICVESFIYVVTVCTAAIESPVHFHGSTASKTKFADSALAFLSAVVADLVGHIVIEESIGICAEIEFVVLIVPVDGCSFSAFFGVFPVMDDHGHGGCHAAH